MTRRKIRKGSPPARAIFLYHRVSAKTADIRRPRIGAAQTRFDWLLLASAGSACSYL